MVNQTHLSIVLAAVLLASLPPAVVVAAQQPNSLVASANGEGTITLGKEKFKINAVVVKLFEDGKAEINLVTDITIFISGTWARDASDEKTINLQITGGSATSNLAGTGKLVLTDDRKSFASLKLEVVNKAVKRTIKAEFVAKS
jgi:hypothetical protein